MTATQSSTYQNNATHFGAHKCIDGKVEGGRCHTNPEPSPWLAIDYGTSVPIKKVAIFNDQRQKRAEQARNVDVRIADELPTSASQMFSGGSLLGHFTGPATNGQNITISG